MVLRLALATLGLLNAVSLGILYENKYNEGFSKMKTSQLASLMEALDENNSTMYERDNVRIYRFEHIYPAENNYIKRRKIVAIFNDNKPYGVSPGDSLSGELSGHGYYTDIAGGEITSNFGIPEVRPVIFKTIAPRGETVDKDPYSKFSTFWTNVTIQETKRFYRELGNVLGVDFNY